ncbi:MAG: helix-turn-helix transcriptional regulator [Pseudomonadota bacterium]
MNAPYGKIQDTRALGALLRASRKQRGVTQASVAGLSGVGIRFLSELERGKDTAELGKALKVLQRLGLELWVVPRGHRPGDDLGG